MLDNLYCVVFGESMSSRTLSFVKNVLFFWDMIGFVILFVASIVVARVFGSAAEHGMYSVVFR